jgi:nucleoside-diphosphate-sugar epimerase
MKVFIAGASGAIGTRLIPQLTAHGHQGKASSLRSLGAEVAIADARNALMAAVMRAEPEVVVHQLTALTGVKNFKNFDSEFALTNRLRTEGTDYLLQAARAAGVRRVIAQSYGSWNYERTGSGLKTEQHPLDPNPPANQRESLQALRHLESRVLGTDGVEGLALRYGNFYGRAPASPTTGTSASSCASVGCRSSAPAPGCGRSYTSMTPPLRRLRHSTAAHRGSTTSVTTSPRRSRIGCRSSRACWGQSRHGTSRSGRAAWPPARSASR